jgi:pimeloyl-ACP methyl ester carboxylesterase
MPASKKIYCISGLGADQRVFQNLRIPGVEFIYIPWAQWDKHDDLGCYAQKMAYQIKEESPIVLGVSFGGMLATEMLLANPLQKSIIVSSAKTRAELPKFSGTLRFLIKAKLIPYSLTTRPNRFANHMFGAETEEEKKLLASILKDTNVHFLKWAAKAILGWRNETVPEGIVHIHGTADNLIRPEGVHPTYWVEGGSHIMIYNKAEEVSRLIAQHI